MQYIILMYFWYYLITNTGRIYNFNFYHLSIQKSSERTEIYLFCYLQLQQRNPRAIKLPADSPISLQISESEKFNTLPNKKSPLCREVQKQAGRLGLAGPHCPQRDIWCNHTGACRLTAKVFGTNAGKGGNLTSLQNKFWGLKKTLHRATVTILLWIAVRSKKGIHTPYTPARGSSRGDLGLLVKILYANTCISGWESGNYVTLLQTSFQTIYN